MIKGSKKELTILLAGILTFMSTNNKSLSATESPSSSINNAKSEAIVGDWQGKLEIGAGMTMPIVFHFNPDETKSLKGTMESPSQSSKLIEFDEVTVSPSNEISAKITRLKAEFKGKLNNETGKLEGTWTQSVAIPLVMARGKYNAPQRPQEPKAPFPYKSQNVAFKSGNVEIAGTLTLPENSSSNKTFPCAILIHGSGPHDRDETIFNHKPFLVIADYLTKNGIAVLRYDKRGCSKSTGSYRAATSADFADDGIAAVNYLKTCPEIDAKKIGLLGHSEGGIVAPMIAAKHPEDVDYIVLLAASAINGEKILLSQIRDLGPEVSTPESTKKDLELARKTYAIIKSEPDNEKATQKVMQLRRDMGVDKPIADEAERTERDKNVRVGIEILTGPWYRFFLTYEPDNDLRKVKCPVLAINGDKDVQVAADENLPVIKEALESSGNKNVRIEKLENINHLMQTSKTGQPNEYSSLEETVSPKVLELINSWINSIVQKSQP